MKESVIILKDSKIFWTSNFFLSLEELTLKKHPLGQRFLNVTGSIT